MFIELNMDGLVGPTHNYAGLSNGNIASQSNKGVASNPRAAALQGLKKMKALLDFGIPQAVLPPQERPYLPGLRELGFNGTDEMVIEAVSRTDPALLAAFYSASAMWAANAATVSPSVDTGSRKTHFTPANLVSMAHRSIEPSLNRRALRKAFCQESCFTVHDPLHPSDFLSDEGGANHNRMSARHGDPGLHIFVHGRCAFGPAPEGLRYPARQTFEASQAIARRHGLREDSVIHVTQHPDAINAGVFHNDVVCVTNENVMLLHERAFSDQESVLTQIASRAQNLSFEPVFIVAKESDFSLDAAVSSYFFNSQLISRGPDEMILILPTEVEENDQARRFAEYCVDQCDIISSLHYFDLRQSMSNGGGPACLRLRVPLSISDLEAMHAPLLMTHDSIHELGNWVTKHYRDRLTPSDLRDPKVIIDVQTALDELTQILDLGSFYSFQCKDYASWYSRD